ncbi:class I SAM-dependent methyltransferase [soil metagenome]
MPISVQEVEQKVQDHFHNDAARFDAIYEEKKGLVAGFIDNHWRGVVQKRLEVNVAKLQPLAGKSVLDVGCGSGRFCFEYAKNGANRVVGVDFAPGMIEIANGLAAKFGVADKCEFRVGTFPQIIAESDLPFDASTANGFFDYVAEPIPIIKSMREMTRGTMIMSFPKAIEFRIPLRRFRFWLKGTPLFLYREKQLKEILANAGVTDYDQIDLGRDYLIVARV